MFTIAIPIYKYKPEIKHTLRSIKQLNSKLVSSIICFIQPSNDLSLIINTIKESKLNTKYEINHTNIGMVENWNKCIKACSSKYLIINHDDDYLLPYALSQYLSVLKKYPEVAVVASKEIHSGYSTYRKLIRKVYNYSPTQITYYNKNSIKEYIFNDFTLACSGVVFNMDILGKNYYFSNNYPYAADEELWPRILKKNPIIVLKKFLIVRNISSDRSNYEFETWYEKDFVNQYVDIRAKIIQYSGFDDEVISFLSNKLVGTLNMIQKETGIYIDVENYIKNLLK
jgi:hypothetical protein